MSGDVRPISAPGTDKLVGEVLANRYQIVHRLGEGAMGTVYRARHIKVGRPFAVKVLHPRLLVDNKMLQRFEREAELAGRLHHPNVIGVVDVGETHDGLRYIVMDFVEGPDMSALLSETPMPPGRIIHLVRQLLEGLYHAHEAGLIHRDFKPENVIVEKDTHGDEVPRIVDFGIAILREGGDSSSGTGRLTTNGLVLGTPHYMAPEQAVNDPIDHRIDLFALGIMIYEMLCGRLPFDGSGAEVARANLLLDPPLISDRVPYLDVDPLLEAYARRLMAKNRDMRPATAKAARDLLELIAKDREAAAAALGVPVEARTPRTTQPVQPRHAGDYPGLVPPPLRENVQAPPQAPRMRAPVAVIADPSLPTQPVEPLPLISADLEPMPRRSRRPLVAGALAAVLLLGGGIAIMMSRGGGSTDETKPDPVGSNVLATTDVVQPELKPEIKHDDPPPVPVAIDAGVASTGAPIRKPDHAVMRQPDHPDGAVTHPDHSHDVVKQPEHSHDVVKQPEHSHDVVKQPEHTHDVVKQPEVAKQPKVPNDVAVFTSEFQAVGAALKAAGKSVDVSDLQGTYSRITFGVAVSTQLSRDNARETLAQIRRDLAARKK